MNHEPEDLPGSLTEIPSWAGELARMSCGCNPQGLNKALGIFYLNTRCRHSIRWALAALLLVVSVAGAWSDGSCAQGDEADMARRQQGILTGMPFMANITPRTFVDDLGRKLYVAKAPTRIISLAPSITETLYAIGAEPQIVGVTEFCDFPIEAKQKPKVGYAHPNIEVIVSLQPDLVLAPRAFLRADLLVKLEQLKIPTFIVDPETFDEIPSRIQLLGRMMDRSASADAVAKAMKERIAAVRSKTEGLPRVRVLYVLHSQPLITVGPGSFIHHVIGLAGGVNIASNVSVPYPRLNMEAVLKEDPEILVFPIGKTDAVPPGDQQMWRQWTSLTAVKQGQLHQIPSDLLNRPGPRVVEGLERLARILHPEAFAASVAP
ncbi:MAG: cobalamin-binding protein [Nitrospirae bacterium]|nr:cobalamin-binding protein [Nitrospirota bacterium]